MKKIVMLAVFLAGFFLAGTTQSMPPLTKEATAKYKEKDYDAAKQLLDQSIKSTEGAQHAFTWHLRGHVYKNYIDPNVMDALESNQARDIAVESFMKSIELDDQGTFTTANKDALKPIANSFWNEAVTIISQRNKETIHTAQDKLERFVKIRKDIGAMDNMSQYLIDFFKAYASANRKIIDEERKNGGNIDSYIKEFERLEEAYKKVLSINPEDYVANYNLSINLYNEGAFQIEQISPESELIDLINTQEGAVKIFERALPYALKADQIRPGRIETVKALRAIYMALNDYDQFDHYDQMVKKLKSDAGVMGSSVSKAEFEKLRKMRDSYNQIEQTDEE